MLFARTLLCCLPLTILACSPAFGRSDTQVAFRFQHAEDSARKAGDGTLQADLETLAAAHEYSRSTNATLECLGGRAHAESMAAAARSKKDVSSNESWMRGTNECVSACKAAVASPNALMTSKT
jgi:hypothetical protein